MDPFSGLRDRLHELGQAQGEWAGIPLPIMGERMIVDPSYAFAKCFEKTLNEETLKEAEHDDKIKYRNSWWSNRLKTLVFIYEDDGKIKHLIDYQDNRLSMALHTMGCSVAWGIEQEHRALTLLGELVPHHTFKYYLLTGTFLESSKRSGLTYVFRRNRPTLALDARSKGASTAKVLAALCMHPIAYYDQTWAGAMCPTDDVIAHLMLMRGDEHMLWKRCNQHQPNRPEAGL